MWTDEGEGSQMTILYHKPYLGRVTIKEGVKNLTTWFMDDPFVILGQFLMENIHV